MIATTNRLTLINMQDKLMAMGATDVLIGEPKSAMQDGVVAIIPTSGHIDETTLTNPREVHIVVLRRYAPFLQEPQQNIEFAMDAWRAQIQADIFGNFTLGGTVGYALPTQFQWAYGYQTVETFVYRILDLTVAYRIDDNAPFGA